MRKRKLSVPLKKALSVFFSLMLVCNLAAGTWIGVSTAASSAEEAGSIILEQALSYLESRINDDGSIGDNATVNDTADAVQIFRPMGTRDLSAQYAWLGMKLNTENTDIAARIVSASGNAEYLADVLKTQKEDGGFGLNAGYQSDVLDTQLVLAAVNDCGGGELTEAGRKAAGYLAAHAASDGSYAYTETAASDFALTAAVLYDLSRFAAIDQDAASELSDAMAKTSAYLRENFVDEYSDEAVEATVIRQLALLTYDGKIDAADTLSKLKKAQKPDGSFAQSVHTTVLAIRLIRAIDAGRYMKLTAFHTDLSNDTVTEGNADIITATTQVGYQSNVSGDYTVRMTVKNGTAVLYENSTKLTIPEGEGSLEIESGSFRLIESKDNGIVVTVELLNGENLIRSEVITVTLEKQAPVAVTEVDAVTVALDQYFTLAGVSTVVKATGTVLYATNIDREAEVHAVIRKEGEILSEHTTAAVLRTEKNSVDVPLFEVNVDSDVPGEYEFSAECTYDGKTIYSNSVVFTILAPPEPEQPEQTEPSVTEPPVVTQPLTSDTTTSTTIETTAETTVTTTITTTHAPHFDVMWMNPVLSNMVVYAGQKNDITGNVELIYDSDIVFDGTISIQALCGEEVLSENTVEVSLEPIDLRSYNILTDVPKYASENIISFVADHVGAIEVTAVLRDAEDQEVFRASRSVSVIEKPVQDLILYAETNEERGSVSLRWNDISNEHDSYVYQLNRRVQGEQWEPRSIWNEEEHIRILNIYPLSPYLENWMSSPLGDTGLTAGMGIFEIDSVHIRDFNQNPEEYLKSLDGSWKYDVLFFGSSDCNSNYDLSDAGYLVTQEFVDDGRGVLFGHDTICPYINLNNFARFADQVGILANMDGRYVATSSVSVVKIGTMTNYPWVLRGTLEVPTCHSTGQFVGGTLEGTEWMTLNATQYYDEATGAHSNFYLVTNNNLGMIQTGHSNGQATDDERKVLANTLFYLYQTSRLTTAMDASFYDTAAPDQPVGSVETMADGSYELTVSSEDNGTTYEYAILASPANGEGKTLSSNTIFKEVKSGLAGFVAYFSNSDQSQPELVKFDETGDHVLDLQPADVSGLGVLSITPASYDDGRFIHVFAIDRANNISEEMIVEASVLKIDTSVRTDKKEYLPGETVLVDSETVAAPFGLSADVRISVVDEFDHPTIELLAQSAQQLSANTAYKLSAEWKLPENLYGRYKAVITWEEGGELLAQSETMFKIAGEESLANEITSDQKTYTSSEPVNLTTRAFNLSRNLVENDLTLLITVCNQETGAEAVSFTKDIASINPQSILSFSDAIKGGTLQPGTYTAKAVVVQDGLELAADSAEFMVENHVSNFTGTLDLNRTDDDVKAIFTVCNTGSVMAFGAEITVEVYSENGELVYTITKEEDIAAGQSVKYEELFSAAELAAGNYSGVLSVRYDGNRSDLAYAGFMIDAVTATTTAEESTVTTTSTTGTTSSSADAATSTTVSSQIESSVSSQTTTAATTTTTRVTTTSNALEMGVKSIPWYIWTMLFMSCIGLVVVNMKGGRKEYE